MGVCAMVADNRLLSPFIGEFVTICKEFERVSPDQDDNGEDDEIMRIRYYYIIITTNILYLLLT
jgi:hypothetical protein